MKGLFRSQLVRVVAVAAVALVVVAPATPALAQYGYYGGYPYGGYGYGGFGYGSYYSPYSYYGSLYSPYSYYGGYGLGYGYGFFDPYFYYFSSPIDFYGTGAGSYGYLGFGAPFGTGFPGFGYGAGTACASYALNPLGAQVGIYGGGGVPGYYSPMNLSVRVGDTVTWSNCSTVAHTASSNSGLWDSGNLNPGQSYSFQFTTAGTFPYFCRLHGHTGTITVTN